MSVNLVNLLPQIATEDTIVYQNRTIVFSADSFHPETSDGVFRPYRARNSYAVFSRWLSNPSSFPHYLTIDLGAKCYIDTVSFYPTDDNVAMTVKNYEIQLSDDGKNFTTVHTAKYVPVTKLTSFKTMNAWQQESVSLNQSSRYIRINVLDSYDTRGYKWAVLSDIQIVGSMSDKKLYYDINTNKVYGMKE